MQPGRHTPQREADYLAKFEAKKTSDDTFTPDNIYNAVRDWVFARYALDPATVVVRPFWPGADYQTADYPDNCVVIDNPPFSILSKIVDWYNGHNIRYFLFAPYLSNLNLGNGIKCGHVIAPCDVLYANGATIDTSFVSNLDPDTLAETAPDLRSRLLLADAENRGASRRNLPKYAYPESVITSAGLGRLCKHGAHYRVRRGAAAFVRTLDAMQGRGIFGGALLLSRQAVEDRKAAEDSVGLPPQDAAGRTAWTLSDREREIAAGLEG